MRHAHFLAWSLFGGVLLLAPFRAGAQRRGQSSRVDIALGVTLDSPEDVNLRPKCTELGLPCSSPKTFPDGGFVLQIGVRAASHVALLAEGGTYSNRWIPAGSLYTVSNRVSSVLIGPRFDLVRTPSPGEEPARYRLFLQVLAGPEYSDVTPARVAAQPGAGVEFKLFVPKMWVRISNDYRLTHGGPRNLSGDRVMFALAGDL